MAVADPDRILAGSGSLPAARVRRETGVLRTLRARPDAPPTSRLVTTARPRATPATRPAAGAPGRNRYRRQRQIVLTYGRHQALDIVCRAKPATACWSTTLATGTCSATCASTASLVRRAAHPQTAPRHRCPGSGCSPGTPPAPVPRHPLPVLPTPLACNPRWPPPSACCNWLEKYLILAIVEDDTTSPGRRHPPCRSFSAVVGHLHPELSSKTLSGNLRRLAACRPDLASTCSPTSRSSHVAVVRIRRAAGSISCSPDGHFRAGRLASRPPPPRRRHGQAPCVMLERSACSSNLSLGGGPSGKAGARLTRHRRCGPPRHPRQHPACPRQCLPPAGQPPAICGASTPASAPIRGSNASSPTSPAWCSVGCHAAPGFALSDGRRAGLVP